MASLSRIEPLVPLNRYLLEFPDLPNQILFPSLLSHLLIFHPLSSLFQVPAHFIPHIPVLLLLLTDSLNRLLFLFMHSLNNLFIFLQLLLNLNLPFFEHFMDLLLDLPSQLVILLDLVLLSLDCLLS